MKITKTLIIILFILFVIPATSKAITGPTLVVNDSLKQCQEYWPNSNEHLLDGWHGPTTYVDWRDRQKYCESIGYTFTQNEKISELNADFIKNQKTIHVFNIIRFVLFIIFIYIFYRRFLKNKKYLSFFLYSVTAYLVLSITLNIVSYQIKPPTCAFLNVPEMLFGSSFSCF